MEYMPSTRMVCQVQQQSNMVQMHDGVDNWNTLQDESNSFLSQFYHILENLLHSLVYVPATWPARLVIAFLILTKEHRLNKFMAIDLVERPRLKQ